MDYLRDPAAIYARSFATIRAEADLSSVPESAHAVAIRVIHACGMAEIATDLRIAGDFAAAASSALKAGRPILADCEMVRHGIVGAPTPVLCMLNDPAARDLGIAGKTTRSAAAVALWRTQLDGAFVVIGNAPTALFALLEMIDGGGPRPAAIAAFPVGFVGAAESKAELAGNPRGVPFATLLGRRGGSAMAAAAANAAIRGLA